MIVNIHISSFLNITRQLINRTIIMITAITMTTTTTITTTKAITIHEVIISVEFTIMHIPDRSLGNKKQLKLFTLTMRCWAAIVEQSTNTYNIISNWIAKSYNVNIIKYKTLGIADILYVVVVVMEGLKDGS